MVYNRQTYAQFIIALYVSTTYRYYSYQAWCRDPYYKADYLQPYLCNISYLCRLSIYREYSLDYRGIEDIK